jgi:NAD(P)-dependent dehydrogenase (short-subunit alcohol dehydrogenase family)
MDRLAGKVALVTGAGSGIGQAVAERFAEEGASVIVNDMVAPAAEAVAGGIRGRGGTAVPAAGDVSQRADVERIVAEAVRAFGRIDILVSNAGIPSIVESIEALPEQEWDRVIDVNLKATYLLARSVVPLMKTAGGGVILVTGSEMGFVADPQAPAYNASKGGLHLLMKSLAVNLIRHNIRVNAFCPGITQTPLLEREVETAPDPARRRAENEAWAPIGRVGLPREMANVALFLASDEASFVVGATYLADGGYTAT